MKTPKGVSDHPAKEEMKNLWMDGYRAKDIVDWLEQEKFPVLKAATIARYGQRYWSSILIETEGSLLKEEIETLNNLDIGLVKEISLRESNTKTGTSKFKTIKIVPGVTQLKVAEKPNLRLQKFKVKREEKPEGWNLGVHLPDMQIGYFSSTNGLVSTHDEAALDVAHQIISYLDSKYGVDLVVNTGDNLDFPAFSSHRSAPGFNSTTQLAINRAAEEAAAQRELASSARIVWLQGNHCARITNFIVDKATPLVGLKRANDQWPVLSLQNLCRLDEFGIEFLEPYPDSELWVNDHLRFEHGSVYSSTPGGTAAKQLKNGVSVGFGHCHSIEYLQETRHTANGPRTHFAFSPGTLSKIDGSIPSAKTGITSFGKQAATRHENWQQGIAIFWWQPGGKQLVSVEIVSIWGGWALWRGMEFTATCSPDGEDL